jgi:hypothetical protein
MLAEAHRRDKVLRKRVAELQACAPTPQEVQATIEEIHRDATSEDDFLRRWPRPVWSPVTK